jgi:cytochrome c553
MMLATLALGACVTASVEYARISKLRPDESSGRELYLSCTHCHDPVDRGRLYGKIPRLDGQHAPVLIKEIVDYRRGRRWNELMEEASDPHEMPPQAIADVAAYASRIPRRASPAWTRPDAQDPAGMLYAQRCQACHGVGGVGDATRVIPRIGGQRYEYLIWQFYDIENGHRQNVPRAHRGLLERTSMDDILDIARFLSRSSPQP